MTEPRTVTLPPFAQEHIRQIRAQINGLQNQLQQFVDGVLCGMGADMAADIAVDLENMTATITKKDAGD